MNKFNDTFDKYRDQKSKYESSYIFIIHDLLTEKLIEHINHVINIINTINDKVRRNFILTRIYNFKDYVQSRFESTNSISGIFMVNDDVNYIEFQPEWKKNMLMFDTQNFNYVYGEYFDINYLQDMLLNIDDYHHVINVSQNKFAHHYKTLSKKKYIESGTANHADLTKYLNELTTDKFIIIHGSGQMLKNFNTTIKGVAICAKQLTDDLIIVEVDKLGNNSSSNRLSDLLQQINHPNMMDRILFGKEITKAISNQMIKTVFCTPEMKNKILNKIPIELQTFELVEIKSFDDTDVGHKLNILYSGIIGVTYY